MKNSVFVTGATGFIGQVLVKHLLEKDWKVYAFSRSGKYPFVHKDLRVVKGNILDKNSLISSIKDVQCVVHLAGAKQDEKDSYQINVIGAKNLVEACRVNKVGLIVNISTISTKIKKRGLYGHTKKEADEIIFNSGIPFVTLKPSVVYGDLESGVFGSIVKFSKLPITPIFGSGECIFRPIHVEDVSLAIEKALTDTSLRNKVYDIVGPEPISFNNLVILIGNKILNKKVNILHMPEIVGIFIAKILSIFIYKSPITVSNILGSTQDASMDYKSFSEDFDFKPRSINLGIDDIKNKFYLKKDAEVILNYISSKSSPKVKITDNEIYLYNKVKIDSGINKNFDYIVYQFPVLLGPLDFISLFYKDSIFRKKLDIASAVVECSPVSADWLLPQKRSLFSIFLIMTYIFLSFIFKVVISLPLLLFPNFIKRNVL